MPEHTVTKRIPCCCAWPAVYEKPSLHSSSVNSNFLYRILRSLSPRFHEDIQNTFLVETLPVIPCLVLETELVEIIVYV